MKFQADFLVMGQVFLSFVLGSIIGFERELRNSPAGVRTYAAVCMGACVFGVASTHPVVLSYFQSTIDTTRIAAQVASGIGFLCAGVIFKEGFNTVGLTTAATLWAVAALGVIVAFEMYLVALLVEVLMLILLLLPRIVGYKKIVKKKKRIA
jgi:putative Mg2+ transporter-C (MgtC) family protein